MLHEAFEVLTVQIAWAIHRPIDVASSTGRCNTIYCSDNIPVAKQIVRMNTSKSAFAR